MFFFVHGLQGIDDHIYPLVTIRLPQSLFDWRSCSPLWLSALQVCIDLILEVFLSLHSYVYEHMNQINYIGPGSCVSIKAQ